jgi:hypothetical protein
MSEASPRRGQGAGLAAGSEERFVPHQAGLDGAGGSSYLGGVICRERDANSARTAAGDATLEERVYCCQN